MENKEPKEIRLEQYPNVSIDKATVAGHKTAKDFKAAYKDKLFTDLVPEDQDAALEEVYNRATAEKEDAKKEGKPKA